ncbi:M48 family metallopeptidase [Massilia sp. B-10]|nr:M48 family metallopeptidase [Massilia sp. B-10]
MIRASAPQDAGSPKKLDGQQLELFAQDFFAAISKPPDRHRPSPCSRRLPRHPRSASRRRRAPDAPPLRRIQLGPHSLEFELRRSTRRSIGFMIDDNGLRVTAPKRITLAEIDNAIRAKQRWILAKLGERGERRAQRQEAPPVEWVDGAQLPFMGANITLRLHEAARSSCVFDAASRVLDVGVVPGLAEWQLRERVRLWFCDQATTVFAERLDLYAARLGVRYASLALSSVSTRWGSCTVEGNIRLNWRLIHFSLPLIDYVVAHELAHLLEMNHSPAFWATVESVYPDYDGAKEGLRKRSQELPLLFP